MSNHRNSLRKNPLDASYGHFGYDVLANDMIVPYIYRSKEKLFPVSVLRFHCFKKMPFLDCFFDLNEFGYLKTNLTTATLHELKLLYEINFFHNDGMYPATSTNEKLLLYCDAAQLAQFIVDCSKVPNTFSVNCGGFVRIALKDILDTEYILPYYVKNGMNLAPLNLVKQVIKDATWRTQEISDIGIIYMKFLGRLVSCDLDSSQPKMDCVNIDDLKQHCRHMNSAYWPIIDDKVVITVVNPQQSENARNNNAPEDMLEEDVYEVEKIIKCRIKNGAEALVRWKGFSSKDDTWEPLEHLSDDLQEEARELLSKKRFKAQRS